MQLRSDVAVAVAGSYIAPIGPLNWEPSYAGGTALKSKKKKKKRIALISAVQQNDSVLHTYILF